MSLHLLQTVRCKYSIDRFSLSFAMDYHPDLASLAEMLEHLEHLELKELYGLVILNIPWVPWLRMFAFHISLPDLMTPQVVIELTMLAFLMRRHMPEAVPLFALIVAYDPCLHS